MANKRRAREHTMARIRQTPNQEPPAPPPPQPKEVVAFGDAPGFEFCPTDEILVVYYLRRYITGQSIPEDTVVPADVYRTEPWNLLRGSKEGFFFARRTRRSAGSKWPSRTAGVGSWQSFKREEKVKSAVDGHGMITVGIKNSLSYKNGEQKFSGWVMYEFELFDNDNFQEIVLCHVKEIRIFGKRSRRQDKELQHLTSSSHDVSCSPVDCRPGDFEGDIATADSCFTTPVLKKMRRLDDQTPSSERTIFTPSSTMLTQAETRFDFQEQASGIASFLDYSSSAVVTTRVVRPSGEHPQSILASACYPAVATVTAPYSMFDVVDSLHQQYPQQQQQQAINADDTYMTAWIEGTSFDTNCSSSSGLSNLMQPRLFDDVVEEDAGDLSYLSMMNCCNIDVGLSVIQPNVASGPHHCDQKPSNLVMLQRPLPNEQGSSTAPSLAYSSSAAHQVEVEMLSCSSSGLYYSTLLQQASPDKHS